MNRFCRDPDDLLLKLSKIKNFLSRNEKDIFLRNFERWESQRKETLDIIKKEQNDITDVKFVSDLGKAAGTSVSILGGATTLIGFALSVIPSTRDVGDKIAKCGMATTAVGGVTTLGAAGVNCYTSRKEFSKGTNILKIDSDLSEELFPFLHKSQELEDTFKDIFGCSIISDTINDTFTIFEKINAICAQGYYTFEEISDVVCARINYRLHAIQNTHQIDLDGIANDFDRASDKIKILLGEFCRNSNVRQSIMEICDICKNSSIVLETSKMYLKISIEMSTMQNTSLALSLIDIMKTVACNTSVTPVNMAFGFIKLGVDAVALMSTADDLISDKKSEYANILGKIHMLLSAELRKMTILYNEIKNK